MGYVLVGIGCLVLGAAIMWLIRRPRRPRIDDTPPALLDPPEPVVPDGVSEVLGVLRSSAVVVGPHDQVLRSTAQARALGLVRGTRVVVPDLLDLVHEVRQNGQIVSVDLELSRGHGAPVQYLSVRTAPLADDLIVILAEDRSDARRVEEIRRDFVANVSHELKTPIGAVALLAEAVEQAADDPEAVVRFAGRMQQESQRLGELVKQVIELSRLQADDPLVMPQEVALDQVLASAVDSCRVDAESRQVSMTIAGESDLRVNGDAVQLATAIRNLVQNAVSYSDPGARVTVGARVRHDGEDEVIDVAVSDNGIGIPQSEFARIFERFYRVDYARSRDRGGTGLGLAIVKHIAAAHGGQVNVWSRPGHGSTFTIRLPSIGETERADVPPVAGELSEPQQVAGPDGEVLSVGRQSAQKAAGEAVDKHGQEARK
ncbi:sensor histidine kinase [Naumannella halotolerans]|uniref:Sensor-like histidine kinase SenX3 n=1 Tax=Naumannella halotolerans TaxID=993414 RepID=A0A4R7IZA9_9ACTN|nr:ATP-binding protein [Naumannella halotolerans]TDT30035.1 two-component system sensor histidine kinase SenX3 [Naumannella halotolerans]